MKHSVKQQLNSLLSSSVNLYYNLPYWNSILNFYTIHQNELSDNDIIKMYERSEAIRIISNKPRPIQIEIIKNGECVTINTIKPGFNCAREDVAPKLYNARDVIIRKKEESKVNLVKTITNGINELLTPRNISPNY